MRLYDFSAYAKRRDDRKNEERAACAVAEIVENIDQPGAVQELKERVDGWFTLHKLVSAQSA